MTGVPIATIILMNRHASDTNRLNDQTLGRLVPRGGGAAEVMRIGSGRWARIVAAPSSVSMVSTSSCH